MSDALTSYAYLAAAVLFILALRGLSHPETARTGNKLAIAGMAIAMLTTAARPGMVGGGYGLIVLGIVIGGAIGVFIALRISMTKRSRAGAPFVVPSPRVPQVAMGVMSGRGVLVPATPQN